MVQLLCSFCIVMTVAPDGRVRATAAIRLALVWPMPTARGSTPASRAHALRTASVSSSHWRQSRVARPQSWINAVAAITLCPRRHPAQRRVQIAWRNVPVAVLKAMGQQIAGHAAPITEISPAPGPHGCSA